ncbi:MAG: DUF1700 domain-containing protein [Clostridiales bacterium]|nr:DUF1700 domain-containing protein [Clostridiales bacterium]
MDKTQYLAQLGQLLKSLPPDEIKDALDYYDGYISDSGNEADTIAKLGAPREVAAQILVNYVTLQNNAEVPRGKGTGAKVIWATLMVLASSVALPLAVAAVLLIISLFVVILCIGISGVAAIFAGVVGFMTVPFVMFEHFGYTMYSAGMGFTGVGFGLILIEATRVLWRSGAGGLLKIMSGISGKVGKK